MCAGSWGRPSGSCGTGRRRAVVDSVAHVVSERGQRRHEVDDVVFALQCADVQTQLQRVVHVYTGQTDPVQIVLHTHTHIHTHRYTHARTTTPRTDKHTDTPNTHTQINTHAHTDKQHRQTHTRTTADATTHIDTHTHRHTHTQTQRQTQHTPTVRKRLNITDTYRKDRNWLTPF